MMSNVSAKDRTEEFNKIVERLRKSQGTSTSGPSNSSGLNGKTQREQFSVRAQAMSVRMHQVAERIQELTRLARQTTMFDDNSTQISQLTAQESGYRSFDNQGPISVRSQPRTPAKPNTELQELQAISGKGTNSHQSGSHSARVVDTLRMQLNSTTSNFKSVLEVRRDALQASQARRNLFASGVPGAGNFQQHSFFEDAPPKGAAGVGDAGEQTQLQTVAPQRDAYLQSREAAITQITADIQGLSSMFTQLAAMVQEQGELALRIDDNIDNVATNVESAQTELLKYLQTISNNRWLALKVFGILLIFVMLFIFVS